MKGDAREEGYLPHSRDDCRWGSGAGSLVHGPNLARTSARDEVWRDRARPPSERGRQDHGKRAGLSILDCTGRGAVLPKPTVRALIGFRLLTSRYSAIEVEPTANEHLPDHHCGHLGARANRGQGAHRRKLLARSSRCAPSRRSSRYRLLWGSNGVSAMTRLANNGMHQTGRGGVALASRRGPVVEARPAGDAECWADGSGFRG
jgi:hypothetical protein